MMLKKDKFTLIGEIRSNVYNQVLYSLNNASLSNLPNAVAMAVAAGIEEAMKTLLDNLYTHKDFEKDIGLDT